MKGLRLYKIEKLCSETAISRLFARSDKEVSTALAFPLRVAWRVDTQRQVKLPRFLVSVPKKRLRHAVDRVAMRRKIREAYRLNRHLMSRDLPVDIAFIYVADKLLPYRRVETAVTRLLEKIGQNTTGHSPQPEQSTLQSCQLASQSTSELNLTQHEETTGQC